LAGWLGAAGLISDSQSRRLKCKWSNAEFTPELERFWNLREGLRRVVLQLETGHSPQAGFLRDLNALLVDHPQVDQVVTLDSGLERRKWFIPQVPEDAFAPLGAGIADFLTCVPTSRVRKCPACVLHFYDTSKKGTRLWCSMNLCGNRAKVAAYADRQRLERETTAKPKSERDPRAASW
jgi:predicted RNA-binding Zn ribbon-like protein